MRFIFFFCARISAPFLLQKRTRSSYGVPERHEASPFFLRVARFVTSLGQSTCLPAHIFATEFNSVAFAGLRILLIVVPAFLSSLLCNSSLRLLFCALFARETRSVWRKPRLRDRLHRNATHGRTLTAGGECALTRRQ